MGKKTFLLLEIFIWFLLLGGLVCLGVNIAKNNFDKRHYYQVVFKDVDSVMVGSPVRIMGIQVGHVIKVQPVNDEAKVDFVITEPNITLPKGSVVTIQFTGLAGSKSIEIAPPKPATNPKELLKVVEPIRVNSLLEISNKTSEAIISCTDSILHIMGKDPPAQLRQKIKYSAQLTSSINYTLDVTSNALESNNGLITKNAGEIRTILSEEYETFSQVHGWINPMSKNEKAKIFLEEFNSSTGELNTSLERALAQNYAVKVASDLRKTNRKISEFSGKIKKIKTQKPDSMSLMLDYVNDGLERLNQFLDFFQKKPSSKPENL